MEAITDTEEGYLVEGLLEMFAEQYSRKLSVRIRNAFQDSLTDGRAWGGYNLLGYKIADKKHVIDEEKAPIMRYTFTQYAAGVPLKRIVGELNEKGFTTNKGKPITINSLQNAIRNPKYAGKHVIGGVVYENRFPPIIDNATFDAVQRLLDQKKHAPNSGAGKVDYQLTGKAYCGYCNAPMVGVSGTGRHGEKHYYYAFAARYKSRSCEKRNELKDKLEKIIVENVRRYVLFNVNAERVVALVLKDYRKRINNSTVKEMERRIADLDRQLDGIIRLMIPNADNSVMIQKLKAEADILTKQKLHTEAEVSKMKIAIELPHTKEDLLKYLQLFAKGEADDPEYRRRIIDRLIYKIFVYDDKILVYFNLLDDRHISIDNLPDLDEADLEPAEYDETPSNNAASGDGAGVQISRVPLREYRSPGARRKIRGFPRRRVFRPRRGRYR
jgi:hypothetical protein